MPKILNQPLVVGSPVVLGGASGAGTSAQLGAVNIPPGDNNCAIQIQNPGTCTVFFEGSPDSGNNWNDLAGLRTKDNQTWDANGSSGFSPTSGANTEWLVPCPGCNQVRVRPTAVTGAAKASIVSIPSPPQQTLQPAAAAPTVAQPLSFPRNLIHGGDFTTNPWQRGTSQVADIAATLTYGPDRFFMVGGASSAIDWSQVADATLPGFNQCWKVQRKSANSDTHAINFGQVLETDDCLKAQGQQVTLSFWAKQGSTYANGALTVALNHSVTAGNDTAAHLVAASTNWQAVPAIINGTATLTTSWARYSFTGTVPALATQLGVLLTFTPVGTASTDDSISLQGIQLEIGSTVSNFEHRDVEMETALCQRFFVQFNEPAAGVPVSIGMVTASNVNKYPIPLPVPMISAPAVTVAAGSYSTNIAGTVAAATGFVSTTLNSVTTITTETTQSATSGNVTALLGGGGTGYVRASADL